VCQKLQADKLLRFWGRIHDIIRQRKPAVIAHDVGLNSFNLDLMHAYLSKPLKMPCLNISSALAQIPPTLILVIKLTIEPNTQFHSSRQIGPRMSAVVGYSRARSSFT